MSNTIHYSELGLVNTRDMFAKAVDGGYAIPAYNFNNLEQLQAIVTACAESRSPVIIQVSKGARDYANATMLRYMAMGAVKMASEMGAEIPICLHLDHGDSFEVCKSCVDNGFSSVMIDGSHLPYDENIALTRKVVEYAHQFDVTVEGELGVLAGIEDDVQAEKSTYTKPEEVEDFVKKTGVDAFIVTLGAMLGYRGLVFMYNGENPTYHLNWTMVDFAEADILGLQTPAIVFLAVVLIVWLVMTRTVHGRNAYAIGDNREAAVNAIAATITATITINQSSLPDKNPHQIKTAIAFTDRHKALDFERYLKSPSGRAFAKKRL